AGIDDVEVTLHGLNQKDIIEKVRDNLVDKDDLLVYRGSVRLRCFRDEGLIQESDFVNFSGLLAKPLPTAHVRYGHTNTDMLTARRLPWRDRKCRKQASETLRLKCEEFRADLRTHRWVFRKFFDAFLMRD
ncbi:hypothetical protein HY414_02605, partial [Candidatus Kaiserbacteria bacterium]|nr:hypothetical protein [Candidatus Kaiserbacteria bacterium]